MMQLPPPIGTGKSAMFKPRVLLMITATALGVWASSAVSVVGQSFPSRPIKLIVPFPAGTPADIVSTLRSAVLAALASAAVNDKFAKLGAEARLLTQDEFARFIAAGAQRLAAIVRHSGTQGE
jgi:tripartite-type tricarboxylate transporter receptor subunit TctC